MKVLILGMGNPILSDDGVGLFLSRRLEGMIEGVDIVTSVLIGLDLLDIVAGYDKIFLIDAVTTRKGKLGEFRKLAPEEGSIHLFTSHGVNFYELMELGNQIGLKMPEVCGIYGIEIGDDVEFGTELSPEIEVKLDSMAEIIVRDIKSAL
jgi:hydrogenase maturation protease